jgi:hypothetical protein
MQRIEFNLQTGEQTIIDLTPEEINALPAPPDPKLQILEQISQLEQQQLMPRATREFMLLFMENNFIPDQLVNNPGYQAVKAFNNTISALRAQL